MKKNKGKKGPTGSSKWWKIQEQKKLLKKLGKAKDAERTQDNVPS